MASQDTLAFCLGRWVRQYSWNHFITLTFKNAVSEEHTVRCLKHWIRRLEQRNQGRINWWYTIEGHEVGHTHFHVLLGNSERLPLWYIEQQWPYGLTKVENYDANLGGSFYVTKEVGMSTDLWDFNLKGLGKLSSQQQRKDNHETTDNE